MLKKLPPIYCQLIAQESKKDIKIKGTVDAVTFDENDNVSELAIVVEKQINEDDVEFVYYYVVNNKKGKELFRLIGKTLEVSGQLSVDKKGDNHITISSYTIVTEDDKPDPDEFDQSNLQ